MNQSKAFEILVKRILINIGFSEVTSDGLYIFDGAPGQMIQGLGGAHNADVLLEPPAQTPFYTPSRLLIECKFYSRNVSLGIVRNVLGLREDINHFNVVDKDELISRRYTSHRGIHNDYERYYYQVAIATSSGYTVPAQKFAATHRIPLLEFYKMPFWNDFCEVVGYRNTNLGQFHHRSGERIAIRFETERRVIDFADNIGQRMAVAITNSGQMLFLFRPTGYQNHFDEDYTLHWSNPESPWQLVSGGQIYLFQLPESIMKLWLDNSTNELERRKEAINCKTSFLSNMIVYYTENSRPVIKMISINRNELEEARKKL
jgi:hypothetical protein